jgi:hypothetical protein
MFRQLYGHSRNYQYSTLRNSNVNYSVHKWLTAVAILSQNNPINTTQFLLSMIHFTLHTHLPFDLPNGLFLSGSQTNNLYALVSSPICATYSCLLVVLDSIILVIFGEEKRYVATRYSVFSNLLSLHPSSVHSILSLPNVRDQV